MGYGAWAQLCRSKQMPFSKRKADMLARVGENFEDLDEQTFAHLPRGWSVLYYLSLLGVETIKRGLEEGWIHPKLTLREARELLARWRTCAMDVKPKKGNVRHRLVKFREFVLATLPQWTAAECDMARNAFIELADQISSRGFDHASNLTLKTSSLDARPPDRFRFPNKTVQAAAVLLQSDLNNPFQAIEPTGL
jgi:hypothetical protein